ncbi:MAG: glycosyltransferase [Natronohydrobacter sp.]|nr:glycosyltransferase [Natronohydrobacter sp.]
MASCPPAISIILPCHNLATFIGGAIASLQAQDFTDFEALVIDDGSTDDSITAIRAAIADDPRFRLIPQPHQGLSVARNTGIEAARGAILGFLDGDDQFAPGFLSAHHHDLTQSGADWTASALTLVWPDGRRVDHPAIHGPPPTDDAPHWIDLTDARDVARLFPSAWNKLYRRDLIGTTRFIPGALYEDHPFFWTLACKSGRIRYLPRPLYHYRRGRPGQITDRADRAIFQQLDRLQEVARIARTSPLRHTDQGLSQLATRLIHERLEPPAPEEVKTGFVTEAARLMTEAGLVWDRAGTQDIDPSPAPRLDPRMRLSTLILAPPGTDAGPTLQALDAQHLPVWERRILPAGQAIDALLTDHASLSGAWVVVLHAGDCPAPDWALRCLETAHAQQADGVIAPARHDGGLRPLDAGFLPLPDCHAAPDPAMLVLRRSALQALPADLRHLPDPVAALCIAALLRNVTRIGPAPALSLAARSEIRLMPLARSLAQTPAALCPLPLSARAAAFAHLAQIRMACAPGRLRRLDIALMAGLARHRAGLPPPLCGPEIGPILRACLRGRQR